MEVCLKLQWNVNSKSGAGKQLTTWNTRFLSKLIITNLVKNFFLFVHLLPTHFRYRGLFLHLSHTWTRTFSVGLPWTRDRLVSEISTYTTHNTHKWQTFTPPAGFELTVPTSERPQSCTLGHQGRLVKKSAYSYGSRSLKTGAWESDVTVKLRYFTILNSYRERLNK